MQDIKYSTPTGKNVTVSLADINAVRIEVAGISKYLKPAMISNGMIDMGEHHIGGKYLHIYIATPADKIAEIYAMFDAHKEHHKETNQLRRARYLSTTE